MSCNNPKNVDVNKVFEGDLIVYNDAQGGFLVEEIYHNDINQIVFRNESGSSAYFKNEQVLICNCGLCS